MILIGRKLISAFSVVVISALLFVHSSLNAQAPFLSATASKPTVGTGEQFQITFTLNTSGRGFQGPNLADFNILSGPNQSSNMEFSNGSFSQSISYSYILQAKSEGNFKIGPASIEAEGKRIASNIINLSVVKGNAPAASGKVQQGGNTQADAGGLTDKNIFIRANVNKTNALVGEAVVVSFKIYTNVSIINYSVNKMPAFNGFWNQDIAMPQQLQLSNEVIDGVNYRVGELKKVILFPQQSGVLTIDPMELECIARVQVKSNRRANDPFGFFQNDPFADAFFGGARDVKYTFKSNPVKINVKALPDGAPAGFNGSVGNLNFEASLDKNTTKANEPVTLKLKISGSGNIKLAQSPEINFPQDLETYDPKITEKINASSGGVSGSKTIEYLLIPRHEGSYTLEPIVFSYYDLEKRQYITRKNGPFTINVSRGNGSSASVSVPGQKSEFQLIGRDIRYIKVKDSDTVNSGDSFLGSAPFYGLTITPLLLFAGLLAYQKRNDKLSANASLVRSRKATAMAKKRLAAADKLLKSNQPNSVYDEVSKALWGYTSDRLTIPLSELSKENITQLLRNRNVTENTINEFMETLNVCEFARYGGMGSSGEPGQVYNRTLQLITQLEGELKA